MKNNSVSVFIPVFNEEKNILNAVESVKKALNGVVSDWEIIIVNDGSNDNSKAICENLIKKDSKIRVINHKINLGLGESLKTALKASRKKYFTIFPGDDDMSSESLKHILNAIGKADMVSGYMGRDKKRTKIRRLLSRLYVIIMNILFGLRLKYYNGTFICLTSKLSEIHLISRGMDVLAEIKIRMIKSGASFREVMIEHSGRKYGKSKAYTLKHVYFVITNTVLLFLSVSFLQFKSQDNG